MFRIEDFECFILPDSIDCLGCVRAVRSIRSLVHDAIDTIVVWLSSCETVRVKDILSFFRPARHSA